MSRRKTLLVLCMVVTGLLAAPKALLAQSSYLDETIIKVKPEKVTEFEALAKKLADANRHNNGDHWLAETVVYGDANTYVFASRRESYADVDSGEKMFMEALNKSLGKPGTDKLFQDLNNCVVSVRTELRLRRPDLSSKMPADAESLNKLVGGSRYLRTIELRVRPGHIPEFEQYMKEINSHANENPNAQTVLVSQAVEGGRGSTFYLTFLRGSLGGFDGNPSLKEIVGDETYDKLQKMVADMATGSESAIYRFSPGLSNPPDEIAQVAADFWNPKPTVAVAHARPKSATVTETSPKNPNK